MQITLDVSLKSTAVV